MIWVQIVSLLALIQLMVFSFLVGKARGTYGIKAPATTGHEIFERYYRVHMNTLEQIVIFLPALWLAAQYWPPGCMALVGVIYLLGRALYLRSYVADPPKRSAGFGLSFLPTAALLLLALGGSLRALFTHG